MGGDGNYRRPAGTTAACLWPRNGHEASTVPEVAPSPPVSVVAVSAVFLQQRKGVPARLELVRRRGTRRQGRAPSQRQARAAPRPPGCKHDRH